MSDMLDIKTFFNSINPSPSPSPSINNINKLYLKIDFFDSSICTNYPNCPQSCFPNCAAECCIPTEIPYQPPNENLDNSVSIFKDALLNSYKSQTTLPPLIPNSFEQYTTQNPQTLIENFKTLCTQYCIDTLCQPNECSQECCNSNNLSFQSIYFNIKLYIFRYYKYNTNPRYKFN